MFEVFYIYESESHSVMSDTCDPVDYTVHGILQVRILEPFPSPGQLPNPGIEPKSPKLQADSLSAEPQGKPKNTEVGSLSLLQWIFLTQESNWVSCIVRRFFTNWAIKEALFFLKLALAYICIILS